MLQYLGQHRGNHRAANTVVSPYLQLAAIVHAVTQGIEDRLPVPDDSQEDLSLLFAEVFGARGVVRLPQSPHEVYDSLTDNATVTSL